MLRRLANFARGCLHDMHFASSVLKFISGGLTVLFFGLLVGTVEGQIWPVTRDTTITKVEQVDNGFSHVWGTTTKLRPGCKFDHMEWFLGLPGDDVRADALLMTPPINRGRETFLFGPWRVQLTPEQIINRSHVKIMHRCHDIVLYGTTVLRMWLTVTEFWASGEGEIK